MGKSQQDHHHLPTSLLRRSLAVDEITNDDDDDGSLLELSEGIMVVETYHPRPELNDTASGETIRGPHRLLQSTSQASPPRGSGQYKISYRYLTSVSSQIRASFEYAAARLGKMITTKFPIARPGSSLRCSSVPNQQLPSELEELFIFVNIVPIDGENKVLGQAGPCLLDRSTGLPRVGYVEFDIADVQKMIREQTFDAVCVHE